MKKIFLIIAISVLCINYNGIAKALNNANFEIISVGSAGLNKATLGHGLNSTITYMKIPLDDQGPCYNGGDDCQVMSELKQLNIAKSIELNNTYILTFDIEVFNDMISDGNLRGSDGKVIPAGENIIVKTLPSNYVLPNSLMQITECDEYPELVGVKIDLNNKRPDENGQVVVKLMIDNN